MKIIAIVHSKTGITLGLANRIAKALSSKGIELDIVKIEFDGNPEVHAKEGGKEFKITNLPDLSTYDTLLIGCPVWAFSPSSVIIKTMNDLPGLKGKTVIPFTTMGFAYKWMGGKQTIRKISSLSISKGARVLPGAIACKMMQNFELQLETAKDQIVSQILSLI